MAVDVKNKEALANPEALDLFRGLEELRGLTAGPVGRARAMLPAIIRDSRNTGMSPVATIVRAGMARLLELIERGCGIDERRQGLEVERPQDEGRRKAPSSFRRRPEAPP